MIVLLLFSFLAGVVTILSPCILTVLPIVLSASVGGKRRPLGVVTGFISSFTFFTLFLSAIVRATGIPSETLRIISIIVLLGFGLSMVIPDIQKSMERFFSTFARRTPSANQNGFRGGFLIGLSLGLVWTPCVGPILASIIALALSGSVSGAAVLITLAYSLGTAIPMFAVMYGGRELLQRVPWLLKQGETIQRAFGVMMIMIAVGIFFNIDRTFQTFILNTFPNYGIGLTKFEDNQAIQEQLQKLQQEPIDKKDIGKPMNQVIEEDIGSAPELIAGGEWFNTPPLTLRQLRGKVVLIDFWTYTCINCQRTLPYLKNWYAKYKDKGLVIIGVHSPEFEFEKNAGNVQKAIKDFSLQYPVMQDNDFATWRAYNNRYWPAKYFIDKNGKIRWSHFGEGGYDESERWIQKLLREAGSSLDNMSIANPTYKIMAGTPELYLGYDRIEYIASSENIISDKKTEYSAPDSLPDNTFAYSGIWTVGSERAMPEKGASLRLHFEAKEVYLVMRNIGKLGRVYIMIDGTEVPQLYAGDDLKKSDNSTVTVNSDRLYKLINLPNPGKHTLKIMFLDSNVELYAFTFG